jgi:hypothetical protein
LGAGAHAIPRYYLKSGPSNRALSQTGRHSGGAKPLERQGFPFPAGALFHLAFQACNFSNFFLRKSFLDSGIEIALYPYFCWINITGWFDQRSAAFYGSTISISAFYYFRSSILHQKNEVEFSL